MEFALVARGPEFIVSDGPCTYLGRVALMYARIRPGSIKQQRKALAELSKRLGRDLMFQYLPRGGFVVPPVETSVDLPEPADTVVAGLRLYTQIQARGCTVSLTSSAKTPSESGADSRSESRTPEALHEAISQGFEPFLGMKDQFEIALPAGWSVLDQGAGFRGGKPGKTGPPVVFSSELIDIQASMSMQPGAAQHAAAEKIAEQLGGVEVGEIAGFKLERLPAEKGMSCDGFDQQAQKKLLKLLGTDPMFGPDEITREKPHADSIVVGGCQGLRVRGKGTASTGEGKRLDKTLDIYAVSDGQVLFLFMLNNLDEHYPKNLGTFEKAMSTLTLLEPRLPAEVPGTAANRELQGDITQRLFAEASKLHKDCEHRVLKAEIYGDAERSFIAAGMGREGPKREKRLRGKGLMAVERWFVQSCDTADLYEVLLMVSEEGGTDIAVKKLESGQ